MFPPRFAKERSDTVICLALTLVSLVVGAVLSNGFSSQAAAVSTSCSTPSFLTAKTIHRFDFPDDIKSGDFNGDHHLDAVMLTGTDVTILLGDGAGNFAAPTSFPAGSFFTFLSLTVGDVNGDGKLDVVRAGFESSAVTKGDLSVLLGDGAGNLGSPKSVQTDGHFNDIALGDFNGDGKLDLAGSSETGVWVMQGDGAGSFGAAVRYQTAGSFLTGIKTADFNGDGKTDLVTAKPNSESVVVLLNDGNGQFSTVKEFATSNTPLKLLVGDFNGDGKADVITGGFVGPTNISVLLGDGAGNFALPINTPSDVINFLASGDFNGDGKPDLLTARTLGPHGILLGDGAGHFSTLREFNLGTFVSDADAVTGDFNEDGKLDVVTNYMTIAFGDGAGGLLAPRSFRVGNEPASIAAGDFNEDGRHDLVVANFSSNDVSLLIQDGTGSYAPATSLAVGSQPAFVAVGDFNRDRHQDLVTANRGGTVSIRLGDGSGSFAPANNFSSGFWPSSLVIGDFNRDDKLDLAVANQGFETVSETGIDVRPASVAILIGDGAGNFAAPVLLSNGLPALTHKAPLSIAAGDLNNDNKLDLVVANSTNLSVLPGDGTGQFGNAIVQTTLNVLNSVVAADFNKDGNLDVATSSPSGPTTSAVSIRFGDGTGNLGTPHDFPGGNLTVGDFNSDGNLDLAMATNGLSVVLGDGAGNFGPPTVLDLVPKSITADDVNGDGKLDLAIIPSSVNYVTILLNTCGGLVSPTPTPTPTPTASPTPSPTPSSAPVLLTEESTNHAIALESVALTRDPFTVRPQLDFSSDHLTRIILFASKFDLLPGENASAVIAQAEDTQGRVFPLAVEYVGTVPGIDGMTQVVVKLPNELDGAGDVQVSVSLHGLVSNKPIITIKAGVPGQ